MAWGRGYPCIVILSFQGATLIIYNGSYSTIYTQDDETALHIAAYHGHVDVVKVLTANQDRFVINARDQVSLYIIVHTGGVHTT